VGGPGYCSAVQRCIKQPPQRTHETAHIYGIGTGNEWNETYTDILELLEEDMRASGLMAYGGALAEPLAM